MRDDEKNIVGEDEENNDGEGADQTAESWEDDGFALSWTDDEISGDSDDDDAGDFEASAEDDGDEEEAGGRDSAKRKGATLADVEVVHVQQKFSEQSAEQHGEQQEGEDEIASSSKAPAVFGPQPLFEDDDVYSELSLEAKVEAILFASPKPLKPQEVLGVLEDESLSSKDIVKVINQIREFHEHRAGGFKLVLVKNSGYIFQTVREASDLMQRQFSARPRPLSKAAMETLSIVAYKQPITRSEIDFIRGVDSGSLIKNLLDRELVQCVGRKEVAGKPMLFGTTSQFLDVFELNSLADLPDLKQFQSDPQLEDDAEKKLEEHRQQMEGAAEEGSETSEDSPESSQRAGAAASSTSASAPTHKVKEDSDAEHPELGASHRVDVDIEPVLQASNAASDDDKTVSKADDMGQEEIDS